MYIQERRGNKMTGENPIMKTFVIKGRLVGFWTISCPEVGLKGPLLLPY